MKETSNGGSNPKWGELTIYGEGTMVGLTFCYASRARQYLQDGCAGYHTYVVDTQVEGKKSESDELVVR